IVLLALQRINELKSKGIDRNSTMITEKDADWQTSVYNDPTTPDGKPSIAHYIKKILMVSDNDAFNRLYEFMGQQYINDQLQKKGLNSAQILHHLNIFLTEEQNRMTNPIRFLDNNNQTIFLQPGQNNTAKYAPRNDSIGKGFYRGNQLVNGPMNFSKKNRISLPDLHHILMRLIFPEKFKASERFNITEDDRQFVMKYMSQYPTESTYPPYGADTTNYWPAYGKKILFGSAKGPLPENIRIFSKEGDAYGHLLDVTYVVDFKNKIEFFLSAVIYCNSDGILNDDKYDYDTIGIPFMKALGQMIYDYELKRPRKYPPDLSPFVFKYDK
ncbi:MAG TPA: serine hydrolase, partial [Ferruginibacter sp.]|nr:serine hydrolase [Ferruginibacter sp.]